jgi:hypothetical protein
MLKPLLLIIMISTSAYAGFADDIAKTIFQKKVDQLYSSALACSPLEKDKKSGMDVKGWVKIQPPMPSWEMLPELESTANEARKYASSHRANDKVRHCLAGCFIAKKLDYKSAVLVGWMKELSDAGDCSSDTTFEKKDYDATIIGAKLGDSKSQCDILCKK